MTSNSRAITSVEQDLLAQIVSSRKINGVVMAVVGELSGGAAKAMLEEVAHLDGKMICVNSFPDVLDEAAALKRNPDQITRESFLRFARKEGYREYLTLVNGDAVELASLFDRQSLDMLFLACRSGYQDQCATFLAWFPVVRESGVVFGTGFEPPAQAGDYAAIVNGSEPATRGAHARHAVARLVTDLVPTATVSGQLWIADKGIDDDAVTAVASGMLRIQLERDRLGRKHHALLMRGLYIGAKSDKQAERIGMLAQLVRDFPDYLDPHMMLGQEIMDMGLVNEAIRVYERPLKNKKGNAILFGKLGHAYKEKGDLAHAESYLLASLRHDRSHLPSWLTLIMLYVERGETARAVEGIAHALDIAPPEIESISLLSRLSLALGDRDTMATSLNRMRQLDPTHEVVAKLSQRIGDAGTPIQPWRGTAVRNPQPLKI